MVGLHSKKRNLGGVIAGEDWDRIRQSVLLVTVSVFSVAQKVSWCGLPPP